jgi:hypothetical protein
MGLQQLIPSTERHLRASFTNRPIAISYLACHPHMRHVVCTGGYLGLTIPMNDP